MRILFIATYSGMTGASFSLLGLTKQLKSFGNDVKVVLPSHGALEQYLKKENIPFEVVKSYPWVETPQNMKSCKKKIFWKIKQVYNFIAEWKFKKIFKTEKPDIVHINALTAGCGSLAAKRLNIPLVWHIREFVTDDLGKKFWQEATVMHRLAQADCAIAISQTVRERFMKKSASANIVAIYNGIDQTCYNKLEYREILSKSEIKVMVAGRIVAEKGQKEVIEAISILRKQGYTQIKLDLVGGYTETEFVKSLRSYIERENLETIVNFCGNRNNMAETFNSADIVVVSSKFEAFGRVTVEAMMAATLVIGADTAGTKELIGSAYGLLYHQGNAVNLAEKIEYAIENKVKMREIAKNARDYAMSRYTAERNAKEIFDIYKKVITEKKHE